ncbi:MAG TPA: nuclear transport factor 2 family protein [Rubrivivax sp.]|nr:nuclear transport factor 2 family protein [Pseudomonadota bacterium]HPP82332.1 nuclear transport factor 2 family protein [Rubrivivax sp.]
MRSHRQIVADHYAAAARQDPEGMFADLADDVQWVEMAGSALAGTYVGRAAIVAGVFAPIGRDWAGFGFELERLVDGGDTVVALGHYVGTHQASGKPLRARVAHVWDLADGKVRRFEQFCDTALLERAAR